MKTSRTKKYEVTCARCNITREWTQKQYDKHMWKKHKFRNEISLGGEATTNLHLL